MPLPDQPQPPAPAHGQVGQHRQTGGEHDEADKERLAERRRPRGEVADPQRRVHSHQIGRGREVQVAVTQDQAADAEGEHKAGERSTEEHIKNQSLNQDIKLQIKKKLEESKKNRENKNKI